MKYIVTLMILFDLILHVGDKMGKRLMTFERAKDYDTFWVVYWSIALVVSLVW